MRKIETPGEIESRRKRNITIMSILMLVILVFSTLGYAFFSRGDSVGEESSAKEGEVRNIGESWVLSRDGQVFSFRSSPESARNTTVEVNFGLQDYANKPLYISSDNEAVVYEIASTLGRYSERAQEACYGNCSKNLPEKNCTENVIVWKDSANLKVTQQDNCVFIEGDLSSVDAFLYKLFGIA